MKEFVMGENRIRFRDGLFFYLDGKGNRSLICEERAKEMEEQYYRYQASMDVDRGGVDPDIAYPGRGFSKCENGWWEYTRTSQTQLLAGEQAVCPIEGTFEIPGMMNDRENINRIEKRAFCNCDRLYQISFPDTITSIGASAFAGCTKLDRIAISDKIETIGEDAFTGTAYYHNMQNWKNFALYLNGWLLKVDNEARGEFCIPKGTVGIADGAFADCEKLTRIVIPDGVRYVGSGVFAGCKGLSEITFPQKVLRFGDGVFRQCTNLVHAELPTGITDLSGLFLNNTNLCSIRIPDSVTTVGSAAFKNCTALREIELPSGIANISATAFENTGYVNEKRNWENGVLYMGRWLLRADASLSGSYAVKEGTVGIADCAFEGCKNLTHIELPNTLKYIGNSLFRDCAALTEIKIPRGVATMDIWTFYNCVNLEKLVIDNPHLEITWPAIVRCPRLTIYAARNSIAQKYARKYKISFQVQKRHIPVSLSCKVRKSNI